ncbi:unnamed protein product [Cyprideis torosa]|uniref:Uncharacterized protein n=1 Tax=Cyprideis torosa TaxID=163714 RepID=A0A7R8ZR07_9CRUS|nr:unnamed protein product [Cyprideis torosa]CAG0904145.1 unnamed protein product [Cyprideis torosa]
MQMLGRFQAFRQLGHENLCAYIELIRGKHGKRHWFMARHVKTKEWTEISPEEIRAVIWAKETYTVDMKGPASWPTPARILYEKDLDPSLRYMFPESEVYPKSRYQCERSLEELRAERWLRDHAPTSPPSAQPRAGAEALDRSVAEKLPEVLNRVPQLMSERLPPANTTAPAAEEHSHPEPLSDFPCAPTLTVPLDMSDEVDEAFEKPITRKAEVGTSVYEHSGSLEELLVLGPTSRPPTAPCFRVPMAPAPHPSAPLDGRGPRYSNTGAEPTVNTKNTMTTVVEYAEEKCEAGDIEDVIEDLDFEKHDEVVQGIQYVYGDNINVLREIGQSDTMVNRFETLIEQDFIEDADLKDVVEQFQRTASDDPFNIGRMILKPAVVAGNGCQADTMNNDIIENVEEKEPIEDVICNLF